MKKRFVYSAVALVLGCWILSVSAAEPTMAEIAQWRVAAEKGDVKAQNLLGKCYANGWGVETDPAEAVKWWRKAAEQGDSDAQFLLALSYFEGNGVERNPTEAVKWWRKAAEQGDTEAQNSLGACYANGWGVETDPAEAVKWWRKAAEHGDVLAQFALGDCYEYGKGVKENHAEAAIWYRKAAEQGFAGAQNNLGCLYESGKGVEKNLSEAVKWFRKAAEQDDAFAQTKLGIFYVNGWGIERTPVEAVKWFRKAAELEDASAQYNLGVCYAEGVGVTKDLKQAVAWWREAADMGDESAQKSLMSMEKSQVKKQRDLEFKLEKEAEEFQKSMIISDPQKAETWKKSREHVQALRYGYYQKAAAKNGGRVLQAINPPEFTYYSTEAVCSLPNTQIYPYPKIAHVNTILNFKFPKRLGSSTAQYIMTYKTKELGYSIQYLDQEANAVATIYIYDVPISMLKDEMILVEGLRSVAAEINESYPNVSFDGGILRGNFRDNEHTPFLYFRAQFDSDRFNNQNTLIRCRSYAMLFSKNQKFVKVRITQGGGDAKTMDDFVKRFLRYFDRMVIRDSQTRKQKFENNELMN